MYFRRSRRTGTPGPEAELCSESEVLATRPETLTLEQKVTAFFEQWRDPVYRYLVAAFGHASEAEEVTQDAFLQLYRCLREGQTIKNVRAWVFRTAHNLAINRIKSQQFVELLDDDSWEALRGSLRDGSPSPEQNALQQERFETLRAAVARLTPVERQCLHLRTKGLRYREIGEILDLSTTGVAETIYRVIDKLTKENNG
jgi:RNA polymerase sigma-70 factor (ECF subfamily)